LDGSCSYILDIENNIPVIIFFTENHTLAMGFYPYFMREDCLASGCVSAHYFTRLLKPERRIKIIAG